MKKLLYLICSLFALATVGQVLTVAAAPTPTGLGGLGTSTVPAAGQIPIGIGPSSYAPAYLLCTGNCSVATSSGSITITVLNTGNWSGTWQGINTTTFYLASNPTNFTTTTIASVLQSLSGTNPITYNSSTGVIGWTNSNGYVTLASLSASSPLSYNNSTGQFSCPSCVTLVPTSTITINGISTSTFNFAAGGTGLTVASSGNSITYTWTNPGYITSAPATSTIAVGALTFTNPFVFATSTRAGGWDIVSSTGKITFIIPPPNDQYFAPSTTIPTNNNQLTNGSGYITNASVTAVSPILWSTTSTISCPTCIATNTGNWQGTFQNKNASDFLASNTNLAPSTTIPTSYVSAFNGATGTVTGVGSLNSSTGTLTIAAANTATVSTTVSTSGGTITVSSTIPQSVATTASPTFAGVTINGGSTANTYTANSTSTSWLYVFNGNINIPAPATLAGGITCGSTTGVTALDTCVNDWYTFLNGVASSSNVYLSKGLYTISDPTGFVWTTSGERMSLYGVGGQGTQINDTATTGTVGTITWGTGTAAGATIQGIAWYGANTTNTNVSSTGNIGWVVNSPYVTFRDNWWSQGSIQLYFNTNTYLDTLDNNYFSYAGYAEVYAPNSSNSGESNTFTNNVFATLGNSTTTHCVYLNTESTNISGKSRDACQLEVGSLAHVSDSGVHNESVSANSIYGAEIPIKVDAGGVFTAVNDDFQNDGVGGSSTPEFVLNNGGAVHSQGATLWANPSSTASFIVNTNGGISDEQGTDITNSPGTVTQLFNVPVGAAPYVSASGSVAYDTNHNLLCAGDGLTSGCIPEVIFSKANNATADQLVPGTRGTIEDYFTTSTTIPANFWIANKTLVFTVAIQNIATTTQPNHTIRVEIKQGSGATTTIFSSHAAVLCAVGGTTCGQGFQLYMTALTAPSANASITVACPTCEGGSSGAMNLIQNSTAQPISAPTNAALTIVVSDQVTTANDSSSLIYEGLQDNN